MESRSLIRVLRRRGTTSFADVLWAAVPSLGASMGAPALLVAYAATGAAGDPPPGIRVVDARVIAASASSGSTVAYFEIRGLRPVQGHAAVRGLAGAGRQHAAPGRRSRACGRRGAVGVPAGGTVRMAPGGLGVVILDPPVLTVGRTVAYTLWFRESGRVAVRAKVTDGGK
ncbi:copper chaperone PCu(A)C [Streptomyces sp. ME18-1-4]|uniref:copper chaperone PCu(A)C n=1 Tax=Streptomyces sp. ME18-1-4 TaxID=3028685 RepID=UPI0029BA0640|nr:copper chaperone PCu(A)C [Streptomyces sp. ME18-1-4]MDX3241329.1 copper chaperone PCu(A)C [Streptomyces sp. ME18-1-4]